MVPAWRASKSWSFEFFAERFGHDEVLPSITPLHRLAKKVNLRAYLDYLNAPERGLPGAWVAPYLGSEIEPPDFEKSQGRFYLMNWYGFQRHPELLADVASQGFYGDWTSGTGAPLARLMERIHEIEYWSIYFGPPGTYTPLHQDFHHTIGSLAQIVGRKSVTLYSPQDLTRAAPHICEIGPGDLLLIPPDWWHEVLGLEKSITVSHNFFDRTNAYLRLSESLRCLPARLAGAIRGSSRSRGISLCHPEPELD